MTPYEVAQHCSQCGRFLGERALDRIGGSTTLRVWCGCGMFMHPDADGAEKAEPLPMEPRQPSRKREIRRERE